MKITIIDKSHDYSLLTRFSLNANMVKTKVWFDIVDNTELNF